MKPSENFLKIDSFPNVDFADMYGYKVMVVLSVSRAGLVA